MLYIRLFLLKPQLSFLIIVMCIALISSLFSHNVNSTLSATTANTIQGTAPYLTFDNGKTKATDTSSLLTVTINDGSGDTITYNGISSTAGTTLVNPIELKVAGEKLSDIKLYVPVNGTTFNGTSKKFESTLQDLITLHNYWGDDDGDGNPSITPATASLTAEWKDKNGKVITNPDHELNVCYEPYSVTLTTTALATLSTQYGAPNSSIFNGASKTYYIKSDSMISVCGARPDMTYSYGKFDPSNNTPPLPGIFIGDSASNAGDGFGFLPQLSGRNFPTTGANNLYFDLIIGGVDASSLNWTVNGNANSASNKMVTTKIETYATSPDKEEKLKVILTGPTANGTAVGSKASTFGGSVANPVKFEIKGYKSGVLVINYSFAIEKWFVLGPAIENAMTNANWCATLANGGPGYYSLTGVRDLINAKLGPAVLPPFPLPLSPVNSYQRRVAGGLFTEWGNMGSYIGANFPSNHFWATEVFSPIENYAVFSFNGGGVSSSNKFGGIPGICVSRP